MKKSLEKFIKETKGTSVDVPWESDGHLKGQCVSLVQCYISECLEQPAQPRGHAVDWIETYVNEGLGHTTADQKTGDLIVFPNECWDDEEQKYLGHIAIYVDGMIYDQNNLRHDNGLAGFGEIFSWNFVTLRPNTEVIIKDPKEIEQTLYLPESADTWRVYPLNVAPVVGNECGFLYPSKFFGLTYKIKGWSMENVAIIDTRDYGRVQIYVAPDTGAIIK